MKPNTVCYIVNARTPLNNGKFVTTIRICMKEDVLPGGIIINLSSDEETWIVQGNYLANPETNSDRIIYTDYAAVRLSRLRPIDGSTGVEDKTVKELEYVR